jgi:hypothetical protein
VPALLLGTQAAPPESHNGNTNSSSMDSKNIAQPENIPKTLTQEEVSWAYPEVTLKILCSSTV